MIWAYKSIFAILLGFQHEEQWNKTNSKNAQSHLEPYIIEKNLLKDNLFPLSLLYFDLNLIPIENIINIDKGLLQPG